jgi:sugar lactone lactonase YvrE
MSAAVALASDAEPRWLTLNHAAHEALQDKDYAKLEQTLLELKALLPGNPTITYKLAAAEAQLGKTAAALAGLRNLAGAGLIYDFGADKDFAALRDKREFAAIVEQAEKNKQAVSHSSMVLRLEEPDLLPEDIAYIPGSKAPSKAMTRRFLVASVRRSEIIQTDGRTTSVFAHSDWPVFALRVDAPHGILWATTGWAAQCEHCAEADKDRSALLAIDLQSGMLRKRIESPVKGLLGDMTISREGDVYVSEGTYGAVLRLRAGASEMERLDVPGEFPSPQTPALSADGKTLYVPDYLRGIARITLSTGAVTWMQPADDIAVSGTDGLYVFGDSFIAVQNGVTPARIVRFSADLRTQQILEANTPELGEPTHGTLVGSDFYFIANTGWEQYDDDGQKKPGSPAVVSTVRKIALK